MFRSLIIILINHAQLEVKIIEFICYLIEIIIHIIIQIIIEIMIEIMIEIIIEIKIEIIIEIIELNCYLIGKDGEDGSK